ncbi:hypothetical protein H4F17_16240 [Vibrio cholerae]
MPVCHQCIEWAIRRLCYVYSPFDPTLEEIYFPTYSHSPTYPHCPISREVFIALIAQAQRAEPLGYELTYFMWVNGYDLANLAKQSGADLQTLERAMNAFINTLTTLYTEHP